MATPTITGITGVPTSPIAPGTAVDLTVEVADADTRQVTIEFVVTDQSGARSDPTQVTVDVFDDVTAGGSVLSGGGTLTQTGALSFTYTAA